MSTSQSASSSYSYSDESYEESSSSSYYHVKTYPPGYNMHFFPLSTTERLIKYVDYPITTLLEDSFWTVRDTGEPVVNVEAVKTQLAGEGRLSMDQIYYIVNAAKKIFQEELNILIVDAPLTVCGDIHGQFYDLLKLFKVGGDPGHTRYLFLGDYVDRGNFSCEVILLLYTYKILYPGTFFMLRGNHECRHLTEYFTFKAECLKKYNEEVYRLIVDSFDFIPIAALMNKQFLCVHGGISPEISEIDEINDIERFIETPVNGALCDLLWSDPREDFLSEPNFSNNVARGCSYTFNYDAVCEFVNHNNLLSIIRAHEVQDNGYKMHLKNEKTGFPSMITLFSAPNYCETYGNKAAILNYEDNVVNIRQFHWTEPPYYLPEFENVLSWSFPFVKDKVCEFLEAIVDLISQEEDDHFDATEQAEEIQLQKKKDNLRLKLRSVGRILKIFKGVKVGDNIEDHQTTFQEIKSHDAGESRPPILPSPTLISPIKLRARSSSSPPFRYTNKKVSLGKLLKEVDNTITPNIEIVVAKEVKPSKKRRLSTKYF